MCVVRSESLKRVWERLFVKVHPSYRRDLSILEMLGPWDDHQGQQQCGWSRLDPSRQTEELEK